MVRGCALTINIREIEANGFKFRVREAGESGEPVLLLHGFPETSHSWVKLMPKLVENGYRCIAPDQRGYSAGARPEGVENYRTDLLVEDAVAIADAAGFAGKFHLVAHDWGAGVGWRLVKNHEDRVQSWTALSIPHPASYGRAFAEDPDQQEKSQYILMFQEPGVAENMMSASDWAMLRNVWDQHDPEEVAEYMATFTEPGAMTAALNWYRAAFGLDGGQATQEEFKVSVPTLTVWGNQDQAVGRSTTLTHNDYMAGYNRFVELDAGHWLIQQKFDEVSAEVLAHLKRFPMRKD